VSNDTKNDRDLVELTMHQAQQLNAHIDPNPFRDEREVLDDPSQKPTAILAQPIPQLADLAGC